MSVYPPGKDIKLLTKKWRLCVWRGVNGILQANSATTEWSMKPFGKFMIQLINRSHKGNYLSLDTDSRVSPTKQQTPKNTPSPKATATCTQITFGAIEKNLLFERICWQTVDGISGRENSRMKECFKMLVFCWVGEIVEAEIGGLFDCVWADAQGGPDREINLN